MELYKKLRPKKFKDVIGQDGAVKMLTKMAKKKTVPHAILFTGPSGCGKTTLARILRKKVGCGARDLKEKNCADFRGIDMVRDLRRRITLAPIDGDCRVWIIDECHKLSNDAMNAFLKLLEDTPEHVYFFLCTTDPQKLLKTIRTRCTEIAVKGLSVEYLNKLLCMTCIKEEAKVSDDVLDKIIDNSEGSARKAMVLLNQVIELGNEKDMLEAIESSSVQTEAITIVRSLFAKNLKWTTMAQLLKTCDLNEAESMRWMIMGYAKSILLSGRGSVGRAYLVLDAFRDNFYDSKASGLVAACYEVVHGEN